jgi:hypothetical protein
MTTTMSDSPTLHRVREMLEAEEPDLDDCADDGFDAAWELMLAARAEVAREDA